MHLRPWSEVRPTRQPHRRSKCRQLREIICPYYHSRMELICLFVLGRSSQRLRNASMMTLLRILPWTSTASTLLLRRPRRPHQTQTARPTPKLSCRTRQLPSARMASVTWVPLSAFALGIVILAVFYCSSFLTDLQLPRFRCVAKKRLYVAQGTTQRRREGGETMTRNRRSARARAERRM